jgi:hypothetical protein
MNCPECKIFEMEAEDTTRLDGDKRTYISAVYYCPGCQEYFRWVKGVAGLERCATGENQEKGQDEIDDQMAEIERIDGWEAGI